MGCELAVEVEVEELVVLVLVMVFVSVLFAICAADGIVWRLSCRIDLSICLSVRFKIASVVWLSVHEPAPYMAVDVTTALKTLSRCLSG